MSLQVAMKSDPPPGRPSRSSFLRQIGDRLLPGHRASASSEREGADPWNVDEWKFPHDGTAREQLLFLVNFAVLAPSVLNRQPWKFKVVDERLLLFADRERALPAFDPNRRELTMSCGAALFHIRTAARHYGFEPRIRTFPNMAEPDLLAEVTLGSRIATSTLDEQLFMAIRRRRTHRGELETSPVEDGARAGLVGAALAEGAILTFVDGQERTAIAEAISEAQKRLDDDSAYKIEVSASNIPAVGSVEKSHKVLAFGEWASQSVDPGVPAMQAPALAVLSTTSDTVPSWFSAGQAIDRILLTAREYGLFASFMNQPMHYEDTRKAVADAVGHDVPQLILRIGYATPPPPTPREGAESVVKDI